MKFKQFIYSRKPWYFVVFGATVAAVAGFIVYLAAGPTQYDPHYSAGVIVGCVGAILLGVAALVVAIILDTRFVRYGLFAQYIFALLAFLSFLTSQANLYGNILMALDGGTLPVPFFIIVILLLGVTVTSLIGAIIMKSSGTADSEDKSPKSDDNETENR